jgi:nicotinate-nucleotide adenylyltransferase
MAATCRTLSQYPIFSTRYAQEAMNIGFFGGSFDPPHRAHIALARLAMQRLGLDRVLLAPVGVQPLKRDRPQAGYDDRVAMTRLAIDGQPGLEVSLIDAPRSDHRPNYTIDTIRGLRATLRPEDPLICLLGADSFLSIGKWYRAADLLLACDFAVAARPGFDLGRVTAALPASISVASCASTQPEQLVLCLHGGGRRESRLYLLPELEEPVSASGIRSALEQGELPGQLLSPAVADYIREHHLYQAEPAS